MPANILLSICLLCCLSLCQAAARNSSRKANDEVLLGTHTGIYHYLPQDNSIVRLLPELKNEVISSIVYDPRKRVYWMGSFIESFTADDLAEKLFISRSSLYLKMNSISGEPPANFIRRIRFNKACKLLLEGTIFNL